MGEHDTQDCFGRSVKIFAEAEIEMERARSLREWARYEWKRGNRQPGETMWREARDIFTGIGAHAEVARMASLPE